MPDGACLPSGIVCDLELIIVKTRGTNGWKEFRIKCICLAFSRMDLPAGHVGKHGGYLYSNASGGVCSSLYRDVGLRLGVLMLPPGHGVEE